MPSAMDWSGVAMIPVEPAAKKRFPAVSIAVVSVESISPKKSRAPALAALKMNETTTAVTRVGTPVVAAEMFPFVLETPKVVRAPTVTVVAAAVRLAAP